MVDHGPQTIVRFDSRDSLTILEVEGALCAWEYVNEQRHQEPFKQLLYDLGAVAMRHCSMQAGVIATEAYEEMKRQECEFGGAYDWDFVPNVLNRLDWQSLISENQNGGPIYKPDIKSMVTKMIGDMPEFSFVGEKGVWWETALEACKSQWSYEGLLVDHRQTALAAMAAEEDPEQFVAKLGEKYDLTPRSGLGLGYSF